MQGLHLGRVACAVSMLVIAVSVRAQSTCLPSDDRAKGILAHLIMYSTATEDPYRAVRDSVRIPALAMAQVSTELVQVTSGPACTRASVAFNRRAILVNAGDNNPHRRVYLFRIGTRYAVSGDYQGAPSDVSIYSDDFLTLYGSYLEPN